MKVFLPHIATILKLLSPPLSYLQPLPSSPSPRPPYSQFPPSSRIHSIPLPSVTHTNSNVQKMSKDDHQQLLFFPKSTLKPFLSNIQNLQRLPHIPENTYTQSTNIGATGLYTEKIQRKPPQNSAKETPNPFPSPFFFQPKIIECFSGPRKTPLL